MGRKRKEEKEDDQELLMRKKFQAKCRFRAFVRLGWLNAFWLIEAEPEKKYEGPEVKIKIRRTVRLRKTSELLTYNDKALLNKPVHERTDQEKKYLFRKIGGLKFFKRFPNSVKRKLATFTYFKYYHPGRVIVREKREAWAMYFIVTGTAEVSKLQYDELTKTHVPVVIDKLSPGDLFGEMCLLHNIPRDATITTTSHCELLTVKKEDFNFIIQTTIQRQWDEVLSYMRRFTYFHKLDEVAKREGCLVAKLKKYQTNDILLGDEIGMANYVYFVIDGRCQMIENLKCIVTKRGEKTFYTLHDPQVIQAPEPSEDYISKKFADDSKGSQKSTTSGIVSSASLRKTGATTSVKSLPAPPSDKPFGVVDNTEDPNKRPRRNSGELLPRQKTMSRLNIQHSDLVPKDTERISSPELDYHDPSSGHVRLIVQAEDIGFSNAQKSSMFTFDEPEPPKGLHTFFMQVLIYYPGATFGIGEDMRDRRIVALTPTLCMLMPKTWLFLHNSGNIWSRVQHYLEKKLPTKAQMFRSLVDERGWAEYRDLLVQDVVGKSSAVNYTSVHDVPFAIRLEEMFEIID